MTPTAHPLVSVVAALVGHRPNESSPTWRRAAPASRERPVANPGRPVMAMAARGDEPGPVASDTPACDDAALVARCLGGDGQAWAALVHRYQRLVLAVARRAGLDDHQAADVFQTVFGRLVQHLSRIADPSRLQAWIVTTTKRESLLQRRRAHRTVSMTRAEVAPGESDQWDLVDDRPGAEQALEDLQQLDRLRSALDRLDPPSRDLMLLLFRDDEERLSYDEIARRLAIPVGSIGPTRSRCLAKLRRLVS